MALFYDYNVAVPANLRQVCSVWGELDPVLAVALENREIHFFTDEGEKQQGLDIYSRNADIVTMAWQPRGGALAVGWSDGMVSLWVFKEQTAREVNSPHTSRVCLLKWAPAGNRLMSADENGIFAVWKVDSRGQLTISTQYTRQGSFTHCVFATRPALKDGHFKNDNFSQHTCPQFFFGGEAGSVHYADDLGHISDIQVLNHAIDSMMFFEEQNRLIVITRAVQLIVYQVGATDGTVKPITKVKLSLAGEGSLLETKWAGPGLLAIASGEPLVRFWNIRTEENSVLSLPKSSGLSYNVNNLSFSPRRRILVAGTSQGAVFFWRATSFVDTPAQGNTDAVNVSYRWDLLFTAEVGRAVTRIGWSNAHPSLFANTVEGLVILHEGNLQRALCGDTAIIQVRPKTLSIEKFQDGVQSGVSITQSMLEASLRVKGISHDGSTVVVWNGSKAEVYEMKDGDNKLINQFKCFSSSMVLRGESIYRANGNHVEICNLAGVVKNTISFTEAEGRPAMLSLQSKFLAVGTDRGLLRVFDVSRRDPKALGSMGNLPEAFGDETKTAVMRAICVNSDGTRICILADRVEGGLRMREPMDKLFVFQTDLNIYQKFDFGSSRYPISAFFDPQEPRLLICETIKTGNDGVLTAGTSRRDLNADDGLGGGAGNRGSQVSDKEITIIFASNEHGLLMQDSFDLDLKYTALLGIQVPRVYFVAKVDTSSSDDSTTVVHVGRTKINNPVVKTQTTYDTASYLRTQIMRDFTGLDKVNSEARQALIDFCYFMTVGNMDEAYRSVKLIENPSVWENMARMCVKTKRLDVAEVCLGNMGHARGAAAVQEAKKESELEVAIAMVAIQLGLRDDAARLYRECGRYDLLNKLYQASGYWKKAVDVAAKRDRIHLKTTYHALARHYEEMGDLKEAMEAYEDAGTHQKDIPRMLFKLGKIDLLQKYVSTSNNRDLLIWWAQFQESQGQFDSAVESYQRAKDYLSIVRVLCFKKDFQAAAKVAQTSGNRAAAYHLARQFEGHGEISNAIHFFASGGCYNHAIRLAKEHRMDADLMGFALMSKPADILDCAAYFEEQRDMEKAVQLYHKGGNVAKALDLCFQAQLFEELHHLTDELSGSGNTSPAILKKCADFFIANGQYAKAVHLCLLGNRTVEALDVCMQHDVKVTEEMAEKMTPPKGDDTSPADKKRRTELLLKLAKCCKQQGSYHLATKKYTQAGNKLKAMKCLLKSGDTEKVVFFANVSRNAQIFILAANYLQNLDWRKDPEILKNIVGFYTKARAFEQLAAFYAGCAQVEIEEYRDYEKAISALQEAVQVVSKSRSDGKESLLKRYEKRILLIEQFVIARQQTKQNPKEMMEIVTKLLEEPGIEEAIRVGDGYAMLAEGYYGEGELEKSLEMMEEMKRKGLTLKAYVDPRIVEAVQAKLGVSLGDDRHRRPSPSDYKQSAPSSRPQSREAKSSRPASREASRPGSREAHSKRPGSREAAMSRPNSREDKFRPGDDEIEDELEEDIAEDE
ncbi:Intraflagellar transport protein 140 [Phytophthora citrophthora]|uniref:Intraflagellar transport protein 140 n=1 Tax=Phytophthora citrophthora TaxID=4793 RepID=A0AAD9LSV7_9STRA|nr:Intraflagellar transport protein 140 [Phytophthora citrophthora]